MSKETEVVDADTELQATLDEQVAVNTSAWTDADVEALTAMWHEGLTAKAISEGLGRSYLQVRNKIRQLQKKRVLNLREKGTTLPEGFIEHTAGAFMLPVDVVQHFVGMFSGSADRVILGVQSCCTAWGRQSGRCYYLPSVSLTLDDSFSGVELSTGAEGEIVLISKAVYEVRKELSHGTFVNICKTVAGRF